MMGFVSFNPACALLLSLFAGALLTSEPVMGQNCTATNASGSYGTINVLNGAAIDSTATFTVSCTGTANQTVRLCIDIKPGDVNGSGERVLDGTTDMRHEFYTDAARTTIWGSWGVSGGTYTPYPFGKQVDLALGPGGSNSIVQTVYARIFSSQQTTRPGSYLWNSDKTPHVRYAYAGAQACVVSGTNDDGGAGSWPATVSTACNLSATDISFGSTADLSSIIDSTGTATVQCTSNTPYNVGLDAGIGSGATVTTRKMTNNGNTISYSLYRNSIRTLVWGTTIGTNTVSGTGTGVNQNLTVYGRIPVQAGPLPGTYSDMITATVTY